MTNRGVELTNDIDYNVSTSQNIIIFGGTQRYAESKTYIIT
jgi:hypothetical protein